MLVTMVITDMHYQKVLHCLFVCLFIYLWGPLLLGFISNCTKVNATSLQREKACFDENLGPVRESRRRILTKRTWSFDDGAHTPQCEGACADVACTVHERGYHQDDQNGHTLKLFPG